MKKFLYLTIIACVLSTSVLKAQCPQIVLQNNDIKPINKALCYITIADPGHTQYNYDFFWQDSIGGWHKLPCMSGFHYVPKYNPDHSVDESGSYTLIGITSDVVVGHPLYGIKNHATFYIQKHCNIQSYIQNCYNDSIVSPASAYYEIKFKGH